MCSIDSDLIRLTFSLWGILWGYLIFTLKKGLEIILNPFFYWYARLDSNQRLSAPEADALSSELRALVEDFDKHSLLSNLCVRQKF